MTTNQNFSDLNTKKFLEIVQNQATSPSQKEMADKKWMAYQIIILR